MHNYGAIKKKNKGSRALPTSMARQMTVTMMPPKTYCCRSYRFTQTQQNQSHKPHYRVDTNRTQSSTGTAAMHRRHTGGPSLPDGGAAVTRGSHDGSRLEPPYTGAPPVQWPPHAGDPPPREPPPVAAHRTDGHGTLLATCPCEPGRTSRTGENQQNRGEPAAPGVAAAPSWPLKSEKNL